MEEFGGNKCLDERIHGELLRDILNREVGKERKGRLKLEYFFFFSENVRFLEKRKMLH